MVDSTQKALFESGKQLQHEAARVMKGFKKLLNRWLPANVDGGDPPKDTLKDLSPRQIRSGQEHIKRLNSTLLPGLG
ncbi:hypothetical protein MJO28_012536 [Puccinia striiformis f. sp. tritici]|uniref:Uncharacterized protein n=2 Tax=Puccinia striiformis TaxID=27350 RepID=A0A2S4V4P5_9BASI|nr:hypothetical protein Pst134EA_022575 [Puccinia striiformis f. sp. tritici]KAI9605734.1 hypothetical protein H4Q26_004099 [Puccinia striiformis f. sp. tritici PST-130]POW04506.1 hypothetical protein PSHT_11197 [Puccinia striiformis]KAH9445625.1 hypothetical protein Pst134EB_023461 [Puccinia striiformis f. sp. tritici]KAH9455099.1 hypothetical protein Pst134EA_022575 [Puccinia striiformis f. sp. tritici]KAI7942509.1 hypothetical protein MJO28_012536 [Puccinia striiformis f. sp. tritici]